MPRSGESQILAELEEIPVGLHHRSGRGVERLKQAIVELDRRIGVVWRGKPRRGALNAEGRFKRKPRRKLVRIGAHHVALPIDVLNTNEGSIAVWSGFVVGPLRLSKLKRAKNWSLLENLWSRRQ